MVITRLMVVTMVMMVVMIMMIMMVTEDGNDESLHFRKDVKNGLGYCVLEQFSFCHLYHL